MDEHQTVFRPDADGCYRWQYELNMFTNLTVFITLCKVFGGVILGCGLCIGLLVAQDFASGLRFMLIFWGCGLGGFLVIGGLSYVLYAAIMGGKYYVEFAMNRAGITHTQTVRQFHKARSIAWLVFLLGVTKRSPTLMGTGMLAGSRSSMHTRFDRVNTVRVRGRKVIALRAGAAWNQVYAQPEQFDAVLAYILAHIPQSAARCGDIPCAAGAVSLVDAAKPPKAKNAKRGEEPCPKSSR